MLTRLLPSHLLAPRLHRAHIPAHAVRSLILLAVLIGAFAGRGGADAQGSGGEIVTLTLSSEAVGTLTVSWATPAPAPDDYRLSWARADLDFLSYLNPNEAQRGNEYPLGDATSLTLSGLTPGAEYKVQFRSRYHVEGSAAVLWSGPWRSAEPVRVRVRVRASPPAAPTGLSAVASDGVVDLVWTAPADSVISGYRILRGASGRELATLVADTGAPLTVYRDDTVEAGEAYVYAVVALSGDLESAASATASVTTPEESSEQESVDDEELVAPGAPSGLSAVAGDGVVDLTWTAPVDNGSVTSGYRILRGASGEALATLVDDTSSTLTAYRDETVEAAAEYVYAVVALSGDGESAPSATTSVTTPEESSEQESVDDEELVAPGAPSGLSAVASDGVVDLVWTVPADSVISGYRILRGAGGRELATLVADTGAPLTVYRDDTVEAGGAYVYAVVALNGDLESSVSATARAKVPGELQDEDRQAKSNPLLADGLGNLAVRAAEGGLPSAPVITGMLEVGLHASYIFDKSYIFPDPYTLQEGYQLVSVQWFRVDGDTETALISNYYGYKIQEADLGKRLKVRVLLVMKYLGNSVSESRLAITSEASGVVRAAPSYLGSNLAEADDLSYPVSPEIATTTVIAQRFNTGADPAELSAVRVRSGSIDGHSRRVSIYSDDSDLPGTSLHVLTNPASEVLEEDRLTVRAFYTHEEFTATGVTLSANTKYWLVFETMEVGGTTSVAQVTGWSIDDNLYRKDSEGNWLVNTSRTLQFGLLGPQTASAPSFATKPLTFSVNENVAPGTVVGTAGATDDDADPPTYSVSGTDAVAFGQVFTMNPDTGEIKVREGVTVDHESKASYVVTINVTDGEDASGVTEDAAAIDDTVPLTINVTDLNERGAIALSPVTPAVNRPLTATLADPDGASGESWTWSWATTPSGSFTTISGANTTTYTPAAGDVGRYLKAAVSYTDAFGSGKTAEQVSANPVSTNPAPVFARPSVTFTVTENATSGTVGAVTASDPEGETVIYAVDRADLAALRAFNGDFSLNAATGVIAVKSNATIDHEGAPSYTVVITATNTSGVTAKANVTINVTDVNEPGTVELSPGTPTVRGRLQATLTDPDGPVSVVTWTWSKASTSSGSFTTIPRVVASYHPRFRDVDVGSFVRVTVSYTDVHGSGQSASKTAFGPVLSNGPPEFDDASVTFAVNENATGQVGGLYARSGTYHVRYSVDGDGAAAFNEVFSLDSFTGYITVKSGATIDHEARPSYSVRGIATNTEGVIDTIGVIINVTDVNEPGTVALSPPTPAVGRPLTANLTEPDVGFFDETWTWSSAATSSGAFTAISGANSATYTPLTADSGRYLKATVSYTDIFGSGQTAEQVSANAVSGNPAPVFANTSVTLTVDENATSGTVATVAASDPEGEAITYTVGGADTAAFNEDFSLGSTSGEIAVKSNATINFERKSSYSITITATDTASVTAMADVTINVTDINEPGTVILSPANPAVGKLLTATLTDPDRNTSFGTWTWSRASTRNGNFTTIPDSTTADPAGLPPADYRPVPADAGQFLRATVTYTDAHGSGQSASETTLIAVAPNLPPTFGSDSVTLTINENAATGTALTVRATDPESDPIEYSVGGVDATLFNVAFNLNPYGQGSFRVWGLIDYEIRSSYSVTITATDPSDGADTISVIINVINMDEPGVVILSRATPGAGTSLAATMSDPDGGVSGATWTWAWSTTRTGSFTTISGANSADYTPVAGDVGRYLKASVSYTDVLGSGKTAEMTSVDAVVASGQIATNQSPQGVPTITGTVEPRLDVRADTSEITDGNGLGTFSYQWVRVDAGTAVDIPWGTGFGYRVHPDDAGKALRVRVTFTDGDGYLETVTSADVAVASPRSYLVSNLNLGTTTFIEAAGRYPNFRGLSTVAMFQAFTTGASAGTFEGVRLSMRGWNTDTEEAVAVSGAEVRVSIWSDNNTLPNKRELVLTSPAQIDDDLFTLEFFSTNGATLNPNTKYWVVIEALGEIRIDFATTQFEEEDASGQSDWSIDDTAYRNGGASSRTFVKANPPNPLKIGIVGEAVDRPTNHPVEGVIPIIGTLEEGLWVSAGRTPFADPWPPKPYAVSTTISDGNFLSGALDSFHWIWVEGNTETSVARPQGRFYSLRTADVGKALKIRVTFTDNAGYPESVTSDTTDVVRSAPNYQLSNLGQITENRVVQGQNADLTNSPMAQSFTTGAAGVSLKKVRLRMGADLDGRIGLTVEPTVSIYTDYNGAPGTLLRVLTNPTSVDHTVLTVEDFTTSGQSLKANTKYWVVVHTERRDYSAVLGAMSSTTLDDSTTDWVLGDTVYYRFNGSWRQLDGFVAQLGIVTYVDHPTPTASGPLEVGGILEQDLTVWMNILQLQVGPDSYERYGDGWIRVDGETETDVGTVSTYTIQPGDVGKRLKAWVSYWDSEGDPDKENLFVVFSEPTDLVRSASTYLGSNLAEVQDSGRIVSADLFPVAQAFTTGNDPHELTVVRMQLSAESGVEPRISIYSDSSGSPGTSLQVLTNPMSIDASFTTTEEFTAGGVTLSANTKYWVVVESPSGGKIVVGKTRSPDQETGWSIGDSYYVKTNGVWEEYEFAGRRWALMLGFLGEQVLSAPQFETKPLTVSAVENTTDASQVVATITASQEDNDPLTYSVGGTDITAFNEDFTLSSTDGAISYKSDATIDYETRLSYTVTVSVTDGEDAFGNFETAATTDDMVTVTINVTNVDEAGTVALSPATPAVSRPVTATLSDPDGGVTSPTWTWAWSTTRTGSFTTITGANSADYTPVQGDLGRYLKASVSYTDAHGSGRTAEMTSNAVAANPPPEFANSSPTFTVNENATSGAVGTVTATDPDNEAITYSVGGADMTAFNANFGINTGSGAITVNPTATINYENKPSYSVTITATDTASATATAAVTINVTDVDESGMVALTVETPVVGKQLTATMSDPDRGVTSPTWRWSRGSSRTGSFTTISGANSASYTPVQGDVARFLRATVTYTDFFGSGKSASQTAVNATDANPSPAFADASVTFTVNENATTGTVGTVTATDPDSDAITYTVGGAGATAFNEDFSLGSTSGAITVKSDATIDHEGRPSYSLTITAADPFGGADTISVTIDVTDVDEPGAVALSEATPAVGKSLTATASDPDGGVTSPTWTWAWSSTRTGSFTTISGASSATYTPVQGDMGRYLKASVSYTDSFRPGKTAAMTSANAVAPNPPPVFANSSPTFTVNENATSGTVGTVTATDPESEAITYSVGGADVTAFNEDFSLGSTSGRITVKSGATIDRESKTSYEVTITATDTASVTATADVTINVTDIDEAGTVALTADTPAVGKQLTATLSDPDGGVTSPTWTWAWSTTRTGSFTTISSANGATYTPVTGDVGRYLRATVTYTDSFGPNKSVSQTSVNATVSNPPPTFSTTSITFAVNENATTGTVGTVTATDPESEAITYSLGGADAAAFNEDFSFATTSGTITVKSGATIDHEGRPSYSVRIAATDPSGGANTVSVTINVTDRDEAGTVALMADTPAVGKELTTTLSDPDGGVASPTWRWSRGSSRTGSFTTISGANGATYRPVQADVARFLRATVTYTDSFGSGKTAEMTSTNAVVNNPPPVFANSSPTFTVNENARSGTVGTVTATDPESEAITYSVGGSDATAFNEDFSLGSSSGAITVRSGATIDHESKSSYAVTITATDTASITATANVTINVTDVDEAGAVTLTVATPVLGRQLTATLSDPDGGVTSPTWRWSRGSGRTGSFTTISGANSASYTPVQADVSRFLRVTVTYTDSFGPNKSVSQTSVNATVSNPPPEFGDNSATFTVNENATSGTVGTVTATDPDSEAITYSVGGAGATAFNEDFSLGSTSGAITVKADATIDHEGRPTYLVRITATDPSGSADSIAVTINVTDVDEAGTVALSRATPAVGKSLTANLTDPDGGVTSATWTWAWSTTRTGTFTTISGVSSATYSPASGDVDRYLKASVSYTDSFGAGKTAESTSVNAVLANPPPVFANSSPTFTVNENARSGTVGTVTATDPESEAITYSVGGSDATAFNEDFTLGSTSGAITVRSGATIDHESKSSYAVTITATDTASITATANVTINVTDVDEAGAVTLTVATPVLGRQLTATLSDPDGGVTSPTWRWSRGSGRTGSFTTISGANSASYTPVQADVSRFLRVTVTYTDSFGPNKSVSQTSVNATVSNPPPEFGDNSATFTVNENATSGTVGTVTATDPDSEAITYSVGGAGATAFNEDFSLGSTSGAITVKADATIDHEGRPTYLVRITATDPSGSADSIAVTINVTDVDEAGTVALSRATPAVGKSLTANLTDPDGGVTSATWTWAWSTTRTGTFTTISGVSSATYSPASGDVDRYLKASVSYTDSFGAGKTAESTSVNAVLANPPPVFANSSPTFTVNENARSGTVGTVTATDPESEAITYSVGGSDATAFNEDFTLGSSSGAITVRSGATIDHESKSSYAVTITATDTASITATANVTINVTDVDEAGAVTLTVATPVLGRQLTATLSDPDGGVTSPTWRWSRGSGRTGSFTTISGANSASYTPVQADVSRFLRVTVTYTDSFGPNKSVSQTSVNATVSNPPPEFGDNSATFTVNENATSGTVGTVTATDPDSEAITYSVGGAGATAFNEDFSLGSTSGAITVKADATIDHEGRPTYLVRITATDPSGSADSIAVTINVTDVDEAGTVALSRATPAVGKSLTANLTDPDGGVTSATWTWAWSTTRTGTFTTISGVSSATYSPASGDVDRYLKASVSYTDSFGAGKTAESTSVNAVLANPPPVFANSSPTFTVNENARSGTVGTVTATDPESEAITYSVGGSDATAFNEDFSLGSTSGAITVRSGATIDHESKSSYAVTITATDTASITATANVTINVTDVDEAGAVTLTVATPVLGRQLTATLSDPDGGVTSPTWRWSRGSGRTGSFTTISGANSASYTPVQADVSRFLRVTVTYTDSFGPNKSVSQTSVNATVSNPPPEFGDNSATFTVNENATSGTVGTVTATDPDSEAITYSVGGAGATAFNEDFSLGSTSGAITVKADATIDHEGRPTYLVRITATDPSGSADSIAVTINVTDVDEAGTVALSRATPAVGKSLTANLTDPDGGVTSATWTWAWSTTRTGTFTTISGVSSATYSPASGDVDRYLKASVSYTDSFGAGKTAESTSVNAVLANPPPVFANSSPTFTVNENARSGTVGTVTATDPESEAITYSVGGSDATAFNEDFTLGSTSGAITVRSGATIDHESKSSYAVMVTATDTASVTATANVTINVRNLEERGEVTLSASTPRVGRELTAALSDPDGGVRSESWSWLRASTRNGAFTPISGAVSANYTPVRADAGRFLRATVAYTDDHGSGKSAFQTAVNAAAPNPPPTFANSSVTFTVNENATTGAVGTVTATDPENEAITYSVGGAGATAFNEDFSFGSTSGAITVKTSATIDHESRPSYAVTITATDPSEGTGTIAVTIKVTNVEEMGTLRLSSSRPEVGTRLATILADPDGRISNQRWEWASSSTPGGTFTAIAGAVSATYTPRAVDENKYLRVTVTYTDGHGSGKSLTAATANAVLPAPANRQPTFARSSYDLTVRSDATADAVVGTVSATDPERDALTYTVTGTDAASFDPGGDFALASDSGRITVRGTANLVPGGSYDVTVEVSDGKDQDGNADSAVDALSAGHDHCRQPDAGWRWWRWGWRRRRRRRWPLGPLSQQCGVRMEREAGHRGPRPGARLCDRPLGRRRDPVDHRERIRRRRLDLRVRHRDGRTGRGPRVRSRRYEPCAPGRLVRWRNHLGLRQRPGDALRP